MEAGRRILSPPTFDLGLDFLPDWFLEPLDAKLALQRGLAHTQMLCSFIHERRDAVARAGAA